MDHVQISQERFAQGFNCSQAVFSAYASRFGMDDESALKLASPFGGGVARQGNVCGAVTGALMVLGLQRGSAAAVNNEAAYRVAEEFIKEFQARHGSILCNELIGYDLSTPAGLQDAREQKVFKTICPGLVKHAAELAGELLNK